MFKTTVTPRFGDIDGLRHVNNTVLAVWFEQARNPIFRMFTPDLDLSYENWKLIMVRTDFDFLCQMYFEKDVELRTYVVKIGNTSFTLRHEAWQEGKIKVKGNAVVVHYDFVNETSVPIPDPIRAQLAEHMLPETEIESINSQEMALMNNK
jgi:acyl-CoA thioester hydrolase